MAARRVIAGTLWTADASLPLSPSQILQALDLWWERVDLADRQHHEWPAAARFLRPPLLSPLVSESLVAHGVRRIREEQLQATGEEPQPDADVEIVMRAREQGHGVEHDVAVFETHVAPDPVTIAVKAIWADRFSISHGDAEASVVWTVHLSRARRNTRGYALPCTGGLSTFTGTRAGKASLGQMIDLSSEGVFRAELHVARVATVMAADEAQIEITYPDEGAAV